jgi:hypothetical protein
VLIAVFAAALAGSLAYRHTRPITFLSDTCQFLRAARKIRRERRFPGVLEYNLMDAIEKVEWDYPPLLILILSLFPPAAVERHLRAFSVINDLACMAALGATAWLVSGSIETGLLTMTLYSFTPSVVVQRMMLTARFLSIALLTVSMGLVIYYIGGGGVWAAAAGVITGALLLLSNALAIQAWALVIVSLAIFSPARWVWLAYSAASLALCYLAAGRIAWRVHRGLIVKLMVLKRYRMDDIRISRFHLLEKIRGAPQDQAKTTSRDLRIIVKSVSLIDYPFVWVLLLSPLFDPHWSETGDLGVWFLVMLLCHLLIDTIPALRFIGPANRYLSYSFLPAGLMISRLVAGADWSAPAAALLGLALLVGVAVAVRRLLLLEKANDLDVSELRDLGQYLSRIAEDRFLVLPMPFSDALGYFSEKKFLHGWASRAWGVGPRYGIYPVIERPLDEIIREFDLEAIIIRKGYVRFEELQVSNAYKIAERGSFEVYRVASAAKREGGHEGLPAPHHF